MTTEPVVDHGQTLTSPEGKVIGFLDSKAKLEAFAEDVRAAGYPAEKMTSLFGTDGIQLLERLKKNRMFFSDSEDSIIQLSITQLQQGHYAVAVDVTDHKQAAQITAFAAAHGGHGFSYFGTWVNEQLS
jgi:hypothetical protein